MISRHILVRWFCTIDFIRKLSFTPGMDSSHSSSLDNGTDNNQLRQSFNEPSKETAALALSPAAPTLPEGGLQAWLTVAGGYGFTLQ